jgi:hypothetical protein
MNNFARGLGVAMLALLATATARAQDEQSTDTDTVKDNKIIGTLQNVEGTVLLKRGEESIPAVEGQQVWATQEVLVTEGAKALLVFNDGCDMLLDDEEVYKVPRRSPCATLWWAGPAAAGIACGAAHANKANNSRTLAAVGLVAGGALLATAQGREEEYREFAAALESMDGDVLASNEAGEFEPIRPGTRLRADQQVLVKQGSKALIRFDDGCSKAVEVGGDKDDKDGKREDRYVVPHNSPCFTPATWWASAAAAAGLCLTVENKNDVSSP